MGAVVIDQPFKGLLEKARGGRHALPEMEIVQAVKKQRDIRYEAIGDQRQEQTALHRREVPAGSEIEDIDRSSTVLAQGCLQVRCDRFGVSDGSAEGSGAAKHKDIEGPTIGRPFCLLWPHAPKSGFANV